MFVADLKLGHYITVPPRVSFIAQSSAKILSSFQQSLLGPTRQFSKGGMYHPELYVLVFSALLPIPFWMYQRRYPQDKAKLISIPVILNGVAQIPPASAIKYSSWFGWWSKLNYLLSAALDSGTVMWIMVIFFCLKLPKSINPPQWWGNTVAIQFALYSFSWELPKPFIWLRSAVHYQMVLAMAC
ncbi:hypothetical protein BKA62DRAFT_756789 [Auriculariales sp. MPI-PUGE-AT-0066]|nr:hypothetical protein BKA62DRAFT_756789 [Auriculariales sp. MPI-PUGE-AT-0066]